MNIMTAAEFHYKLVNLQENLSKYAFSLTADKEDAKDLVQETFLKALKCYEKYIYETNFKGWMFTIMKNTFINTYRQSKNHHTFCDPINEGFYLKNVLSPGSDNPESRYISKEIEDIIETLNENFKIPFKMHHEGFKYKEIADMLELKIGTVKSRIFFTRKKIIKQLIG